MESGGSKRILIIPHCDIFKWYWWWCAMAKQTHDTPANAIRCNPCGCQGIIGKGIDYYQFCICSCKLETLYVYKLENFNVHPI
jgi:hypothetical protein